MKIRILIITIIANKKILRIIMMKYSKKKSGRGRTKGSKNINSIQKSSILAIKAANPDWSAEKIRRKLESVKKITNSAWQIPKIRAIQIILSNPENKQLIDSLDCSLDTPWHLGRLDKFHIPPEIVP